LEIHVLLIHRTSSGFGQLSGLKRGVGVKVPLLIITEVLVKFTTGIPVEGPTK
jgi:hypothetical protein